MIDIRFRPLRWEGPSTPAFDRRSRNAFKASWSSTLDLLGRELSHLDAVDVVLEADLAERDIRADGWPKANARQPVHPGVRVAFGSKHGPLVYATDSCEFWQHNLRSIALGLEALRAVDRYGVTHRGEQYTGWRQITAAAETFASADSAWEYLQRTAGERRGLPIGEVHEDELRRVVRLAQRATHPDRGGSPSQFQQVEVAARMVRGRVHRWT